MVEIMFTGNEFISSVTLQSNRKVVVFQLLLLDLRLMLIQTAYNGSEFSYKVNDSSTSIDVIEYPFDHIDPNT